MTASVPPTGQTSSGPAPGTASTPRPPLPTWVVALVLAGVALLLAVVGNLPFMGLPGALWIGLAAPVAGLVTDRTLPADAAWPMAIIVTLIWPWFLPLSWLAAGIVLPRGRARWVATAILTALGAILVAAWFQVREGRLG